VARVWWIAINVPNSNAMLFVKAGWQFPKPRPVQFLGEPIQWVDTARYLGVTLEIRMTWPPHIVQLRLGKLTSLLHRRRGLSIRNGVLLYKQLRRHMMDYACRIWRSAACSHHRKLQVIQSQCLRIATGAPVYISNVYIYQDLGVPFFAEHITALTESYDSNLGGLGNPLVQQLGRYLR
jgi:hypothetical protein